jgi:hypothetical protein
MNEIIPNSTTAFDLVEDEIGLLLFSFSYNKSQ